MQDFLNKTFFQNSIRSYMISLGLFLAGFMLIKIFRYFILKRLKKFSERTATTIDDFLVGVVRKIFIPVSYLGVFYLSINVLILHELLKRIIDIAALAILTYFSALLASIVVKYGFDFYLIKRGRDEALQRSMTGILRVAKAIIWGIALILFLDNMGFEISAIIAGLGVGGIAVGLAAQAILGDLFSYFSILFDRPFEIGDFIIVGEFLGTIEHIGVKTTRIRSLGGEQVIFSNTDLTGSRVRNYKRMDLRRVVFKVGVTYQTPLDKLKEIPGMIKNVIEGTANTRFDRAHFFSYGDFSLVFEVVYYVLDRDYNKYMDVQQEINFRINEEFKKRNIEFAYPTQTLYVAKEEGKD